MIVLNTNRVCRLRLLSAAIVLVLIISMHDLPLFASTAAEPDGLDLPSTSGHVAAGLAHSLFIHLDGRLYAMGDNGVGQLGIGDPAGHESPVPVSLPEKAAAVSAGAYHSLVLTTGGDVYAFGRNAYGQLGTGTIDNSATPQKIDSLPAAKAIAAGAYHSLVLANDGSVWAFGNHTDGQCGPALAESIQSESGELVAQRVVRPQRIIPSAAVAITAGSAHSLVLLENGQVLAFGDNSHGQLGDGSTISRQEPIPIAGISQAIQIAAGSDHSLIVSTKAPADSLQTLHAFGDNSLGQVGIGTAFKPDDAVLTPSVVNWTEAAGRGTYRIQHIFAGFSNSILTVTQLDQEPGDPRNTKILVWGSNANGQLGDGGGNSQAFPNVLKANDQEHVSDTFLPIDHAAVGGGHILLFSSRGLLGAVGRNDYGQSGLAGVLNHPIFTNVPLPQLDEPVLLPGDDGTTTDAAKLRASVFGDLLNDGSYAISNQVPWDTAPVFGPDSIRRPFDKRVLVMVGTAILVFMAAILAVIAYYRKQRTLDHRQQKTPDPGKDA